MNIVHIGPGTTAEEIEHIVEQRDAGHDYFVPGESTHEQTVRRIMDADEIHIWDITREFELGMVYFYSVHALHHKLHWRIRIFGDTSRPYLAWFQKIARDHQEMLADRDRLVESIRIGETVFMPVPVKAVEEECQRKLPCEWGTGPCDAERATLCAGRGGCAKQAAYKQSYTRDDLTHEDEGTYGGVREICSLCYADAYSGVAIAHAVDCPLVDPGVLGVMLTSFEEADDGTTQS